MTKKNRVLYIFFFVISGILICVVFLDIPTAWTGFKQFGQNVGLTEKQHLNRSIVHLYFSDRNNLFLKAEKKNIFHSDNPTELGKIIVEDLINGPRTGLMRTIPEDTTLKAFYIIQDGTAFVDLSDTIKDAHPGGVKSELFSIYSIVNSLILNIPDVDAVKILIGGREMMTLGGHIDLRFPFKANMLLIR